jgi:hypothetical protein
LIRINEINRLAHLALYRNIFQVPPGTINPMEQIKILTKQTQDAYNWANKIIRSIPASKWDHIPEVVETNVTWQIGHLTVSFYFHSIMVIKGHQTPILKKIPLKAYDALFTNALPVYSIGQAEPEKLFEDFIYMQQESMAMIKSVSDEDLEMPLEVTEVPHPIARSKFEALDWNIKHTMWHCGQLGILKRVIDSRFDFGLKR